MKKLPPLRLKNWDYLADIKNIAFALGCTFAINVTAIIVMRLLEIDQYWLFTKSVSPPKELIYVCIFAPFLEESIFRWLPISFAKKFFGEENFKNWRWHFAAVISIIFGISHHGYFNIFLQGAAGFFYCYLYYKNRFGYLSGVVAHSLWNLSLCFVLPYCANFPPPNPFFF